MASRIFDVIAKVGVISFCVGFLLSVLCLVVNGPERVSIFFLTVGFGLCTISAFCAKPDREDRKDKGV